MAECKFYVQAGDNLYGPFTSVEEGRDAKGAIDNSKLWVVWDSPEDATDVCGKVVE